MQAAQAAAATVNMLCEIDAIYTPKEGRMTLAYRMVLAGSSGSKAIMASLCSDVVVYSIAMVPHVRFDV